MEENLKIKKAFLFISAGMMEITWIYALACTLFLMLSAPIFPIWSAILAFYTPMIITSILNGRGKRIIEYVALHLFTYLFIFFCTLYFYGNWEDPFLHFQWLEMILHQQYGPIDGFAYFLVLICFSFLWISGYKSANRSNNYLMITSRFDLGIIALIFTFIILGSMKLTFLRAGILIAYYFLFSMLAISLAKNLRSSKTQHSCLLSGASLVITFILVVLLLGSWIVLFFLPQLTSAAQTGYYVLKIIAKPLGNFLLKIIRLLFGFNNRNMNVTSTYSSDSEMPLIENIEPTWWMQLLNWIITRGVIIILGLFAMIALSWLIWSLWKWLSTKTNLDTEKKYFLEELYRWFIQLFSHGKKALYKILKNLKNIWKKPENISVIFQNLCRWGHSSGIPREKSKTPQEYGKYLSHFFPESQQEIKIIIETFNQEIYGKKSIQTEQLNEAKKAWGHLVSPSQWPLRFAVKLFYARKFNSQEIIS